MQSPKCNDVSWSIWQRDQSLSYLRGGAQKTSNPKIWLGTWIKMCMSSSFLTLSPHFTKISSMTSQWLNVADAIKWKITSLKGSPWTDRNNQCFNFSLVLWDFLKRMKTLAQMVIVWKPYCPYLVSMKNGRVYLTLNWGFFISCASSVPSRYRLWGIRNK